MRILVQRVKSASVRVSSGVIGQIGPGLLLFVGIGREDSEGVTSAMAAKVLNLRIMADEAGKMNRSVLESGGGILAVSQFTLYADCRKGRRPNFLASADPVLGARLFDQFIVNLRSQIGVVETGQFGAMMEVELVNDGPVTIWLDSSEVLGGREA